MITVKISAHSNDSAYKTALERQLLPLVEGGRIRLLGRSGQNPFEAFEETKIAVELLVVLLSPDYLSHPKLEAQDIAPVLEMKAQNSRCYWVQPVLLRHCDYSQRPYSEFPSFPIPSGAATASPILGGDWPTELDAMLSVVESIKLGIAYIETHKNMAKPNTDASFPQKVLLMTSNPKDAQQLELNAEINTIRAILRRAQERERYGIELSLDVTREGFLETLLQEKPAIVHFSGHGVGQNGLLFYGKNGMSELASGDGLANLFRLFSKHIRCVLLNACYSQEQAVVISQHINYVIGTDNAISDSKAIEFSKGFYTALFNGEDIESAFEMAVAHVDFQNLPPSAQPLLFKNGEKIKGPQMGSSSLPTGEINRGINPVDVKELPLPDEDKNPPIDRSWGDNTWTDPRDAQVYKTVKIGTLVWLAENLRFEQSCSIAGEDPRLFGRFYTWQQAQDACPEGWQLPTLEQWEELIGHLGDKLQTAAALKSTSGWQHGQNGNNNSGFNAQPAGEYQPMRKGFWNIGSYTLFWSQTDLHGKMYGGDRLAYRLRFSASTPILIDSAEKTNYCCLRLVRSESIID